MEHQYEVILCQLNAMQVNVTVEHPSVRLSVLSINSSDGGRRVCC